MATAWGAVAIRGGACADRAGGLDAAGAYGAMGLMGPMGRMGPMSGWLRGKCLFS